jgi:hypothetical protein
MASTTHPVDMLLTDLARIYRKKMRTTGSARSFMIQFSFLLFIDIIIIYQNRKSGNILA